MKPTDTVRDLMRQAPPIDWDALVDAIIAAWPPDRLGVDGDEDDEA